MVHVFVMLLIVWWNEAVLETSHWFKHINLFVRSPAYSCSQSWLIKSLLFAKNPNLSYHVWLKDHPR
uniref:Uncharacterized protein n=1 Tax=Phlebotomus papatasi TaxID=29031 RepID=A0A1B0DAN1_PHLPP